MEKNWKYWARFLFTVKCNITYDLPPLPYLINVPPSQEFLILMEIRFKLEDQYQIQIKGDMK